MISLFDLIYPPLCLACHDRLIGREKDLCLTCRHSLPQTHFHLESPNRLEHLFWGRFPIERATACYYFNRGTGVRSLIHALKYSSQRQAIHRLGTSLALQIARESSFFEGIDAIVAVPLHSRKERQRGFNQSELLASAIATQQAIPLLSKIVRRTINNPTQTHLHRHERWNNVEHIFNVTNQESLRKYQHLLLIDDVITTGSTISSLACTLSAAHPGLKISILALAYAGE